MTTLKIKIPQAEMRNWKFIEDVPFTSEEIMEIIHRYCDAQDHAKSYRVRRAEHVKAVLAAAKKAGIKV